MPTYDYECEACNHTFELFQSITAKQIRKCPECKKVKGKTPNWCRQYYYF